MALHLLLIVYTALNVYLINVNANSGQKFTVQDTSFGTGSINRTKLITKLTPLNDFHKYIMVHWVGNSSDVIIYLARDPIMTLAKISTPSNLYISYDNGNSYKNMTHSLKLENGKLAVIDKFYYHPEYDSKIVFTDISNKVMFVTSDHGYTTTILNLSFKPNKVLFHEFHPDTLLALETSNSQLWVSEDFGNSWRLLDENINTFFWNHNNSSEPNLVLHRIGHGLNEINYIRNLSSKQSVILASDVHDIIYKKQDYVFFTKNSSEDKFSLFVSYKLDLPKKCIFHSELNGQDYYVVDVTDNRAFVAVSVTDTLSHLYISEDLRTNAETIHFYLSLKRILCHFPKKSSEPLWLQRTSSDAFADVYKVQGVSGVYIASQLTPSIDWDLGNLITLITFNHGHTWRRLNSPVYDTDGNPISCSLADECSLHLNQRFSHLHPEVQVQSIQSSASAPGIIIATGVIGKSLKGHSNVYISTDAGLTWNQTLKDPHLFQIGNNGSVIAAVKYNQNTTKTKHVLYSTNYGKHWTRSEFNENNVRVYAIVTQPGETTAIFTLFVSPPDMHSASIIKVNMQDVFTHNCTEADYEEKSLSHVCSQGQQVTFLRRKQNASCYVDSRIMSHSSTSRPCSCDISDFECESGFFRSNDHLQCIRNKTIIDDPYDGPLDCPPGQFYNRTKGYKKYIDNKCMTDHAREYLSDVISCPPHNNSEFLLVALRDRIGRYELRNHTWEILPILNLKNAIAVEFDMRSNCVYWADYSTQIIGRQCLSNTTPEVLVFGNMTSIDGLALDWISQHLYFVDGPGAKIEMITTNIPHLGHMRRTILDFNHLRKPRGIALHPVAGYLFWTDWSQEKPSVSRSNLDGSDIRVLFNEEYVQWPNGITVDYIAERIYWVDARKHYIGSSNLHGNHFKKIIQNNNDVSHPFAIAIFKNTMYWNDWKKLAIFRADKDNGSDEELLKQIHNTMDIKVFGHGLQEGMNKCVHSTCSHICVGAPENGHMCLCPNGMELKIGKCICSALTCDNGNCIAQEFHCNGIDECGDGSDEVHCALVTTEPQPNYCGGDYFRCGNNACIPKGWLCDRVSDCKDGSDELNCAENQTCVDGQFKCGNGTCIPLLWQCDGDNDCIDDSDEYDCSNNTFKNKNNTCQDKSDEHNCTSITGIYKVHALGADERSLNESSLLIYWRIQLPSTVKVEFLPSISKIGSNIFKNQTWVESTEYRFIDLMPYTEYNITVYVRIKGSDMAFPPTTYFIAKTAEGTLTDPWNVKICVGATENGHKCLCPNVTVPKMGKCICPALTCDNGNCIAQELHCNGIDECGDGSDEAHCALVTTEPQPNYCVGDYFRCENNACIPKRWLCDGAIDCEDRSDELNCPKITCSPDQFQCAYGFCIPALLKCDNNFDCYDQSDEKDCVQIEVPVDDEFKCVNGMSIPLRWQCDGENDCIDNSDEYDCSNKTLTDKNNTCQDKSDEHNCNSITGIYQVYALGADKQSLNESSLLIYWQIQLPSTVEVEFLPSISKIGSNIFENQTWVESMEYRFIDLVPHTKYNITVYVRIKGSDLAFPPTTYFIAQTMEGKLAY